MVHDGDQPPQMPCTCNSNISSIYTVDNTDKVMDAGNDEMDEIASIPSDGDDHEDDEEESDERDIGGRIENVFLLLWTKTTL